MDRFDEKTPIASGLKEIAALVAIFGVGRMVAEWAGPITGYRMVSAIFGFLTALLMLFVSRWVFAGEAEKHKGIIGRQAQMMKVVKWVLILGLAIAFSQQTLQIFADGIDYNEANIFGFWSGIVVAAIIVTISEKGSSRRKVRS